MSADTLSFTLIIGCHNHSANQDYARAMANCLLDSDKCKIRSLQKLNDSPGDIGLQTNKQIRIQDLYNLKGTPVKESTMIEKEELEKICENYIKDYFVH